MPPVIKSAKLINSVQRWKELAPPRNPDRQWKPGKSAMELARAWLSNGGLAVPNELANLLRDSRLTPELTPDLEFIEAHAEASSKFDEFSGDRLQDLEVLCRNKISKEWVILSVEGKCTENFGRTIKSEYHKPEGQNIQARIVGLLHRIFGDAATVEQYFKIRYQLIHGLAGAVAAAKHYRSPLAVFLVHEFVTEEQSRSEAVKNNWNDYITFAKLFKDQMQNVNIDELGHNHLIGPFHFAEPGNPEFLIGHLRTIIK
jgi:hypothetical protein